jgi:hypothetical protein
MIIDHRTYDIKPGCLPKFLQLYGTEGFPVQLKHLGQPYGYFTVTDIGPLNQVIHLWKYDSLADREAKRGALQADPAWQAYLAKSGEAGYIARQENKILKAAPFWMPK